MTPKEYLTIIRKKDDAVDRQLEFIESLKATLTNITAKIGDDIRVQSSSEPDKFAKVFAQIDEENEKLNRLTDEFVDFKAQALERIYKSQNDFHIKLLCHVYIEYMSLVHVAEITGYSYEYILEVHGRALKEFKHLNPDIFKSSKGKPMENL